MTLRKMLQDAKSFAEHPVQFTVGRVKRNYEECRKAAYEEATSWEETPVLRFFYKVLGHAARLLSFAIVLIYPRMSTVLAESFLAESLPMSEWTSGIAVLQAFFLLPVIAIVLGMLTVMYCVPIHFLCDEHMLVRHLKSVTITLGVLMILSPILQIVPVYTWHLPLFDGSYLRLSEVLFILGICGIVVSVLLMVICEIANAVNFVISLFRWIFRLFSVKKDQGE